MPTFPERPVSPAEILERFLPAALAELEVPEGLEALKLDLGVRLEGEGGGEWVVRLEDGAARVQAADRGETLATYVQSVEHWRGALWHGEGAALGRAVARLFRPEPMPPAGVGPAAQIAPVALEALRPLQGRLRLQVQSPDAASWNVDLQLGPGAIPEEPTTTVELSAADAEDIFAGRLNPIEAFMAGRIQLLGDMSLVLQLQAAQMQAIALLGAQGADED